MKREATRKAIMEALESLLARHSYQEVRVEDLMGSAGLTRTAFYRYFPDLESVLLAWIETIRGEFQQAADRFLAPDVDPEKGLLEANRALAEVWHRHRSLLRGIFDAATTGNSVQLAWRQLVESFIVPVEQRLESLSQQGRASIADSAETARALVWMNERYFFETIAREAGVPTQVAASTLADIWRRVLFPVTA